MTEGVKKCYEFPRVFGDQFALWLEAHLVLAIHDHNICPRRTLNSLLSQFQGKVSFKQGIATTSSKYWSNPLQQLYNLCQLLAIYVFGVQKGFRCQRIARDWSGRSVLLARSSRFDSDNSAPTSFPKSTVPLFRVKGLRATERLEKSSERLAPGLLRWVLIYLLCLCFRLLPHVPHVPHCFEFIFLERFTSEGAYIAPSDWDKRDWKWKKSRLRPIVKDSL